MLGDRARVSGCVLADVNRLGLARRIRQTVRRSVSRWRPAYGVRRNRLLGGGDNPHHRYPLRNVGELSYQIKIHKDADSIGEVNQVQALRECYPGGTYLHLAKAYEAKRWVAGAFDKPYIQVKRTSPQRRTRPRIRTWVNTGLDNVQHSNFLKGDHGFLTESAMLITQKVEGYSQDGKYFDYTDLQKTIPTCVRSRAISEPRESYYV